MSEVMEEGLEGWWSGRCGLCRKRNDVSKRSDCGGKQVVDSGKESSYAPRQVSAKYPSFNR